MRCRRSGRVWDGIVSVEVSFVMLSQLSQRTYENSGQGASFLVGPKMHVRLPSAVLDIHLHVTYVAHLLAKLRVRPAINRRRVLLNLFHRLCCPLSPVTSSGCSRFMVYEMLFPALELLFHTSIQLHHALSTLVCHQQPRAPSIPDCQLAPDNALHGHQRRMLGLSSLASAHPSNHVISDQNADTLGDWHIQLGITQMRHHSRHLHDATARRGEVPGV